MRGIFISYRRDDAEGQAGRLFDDLSEHFGRDAIFMDVTAIKKGLDFRRIIDEHVASCGVLLVIIGKRWLSATDSKGKRRLDDVNDFVRLETAAALSRDIPVVPVLVQDAVMPTEQELPGALKELAFRNGTELTHARWDSDVKLLVEDLKPFLDEPATAPAASETARDPTTPTVARETAKGGGRAGSRLLWATGGAVTIVVASSLFGYRLWQGVPTSPDRTKAALQVLPTAPTQTRDATAVPSVPNRTPNAAAEPADQPPSQADAAKAAARAAAVRKEANDRRRREEAARAVQLAEEQRKRDEEARRVALEQAEKDRIAAEKAAGARIFAEIATAAIGTRQNNRR